MGVQMVIKLITWCTYTQFFSPFQPHFLFHVFKIKEFLVDFFFFFFPQTKTKFPENKKKTKVKYLQAKFYQLHLSAILCFDKPFHFCFMPLDSFFSCSLFSFQPSVALLGMMVMINFFFNMIRESLWILTKM